MESQLDLKTKNRERVLLWQRENPEKYKERCRRWREKNREKERERHREYEERQKALGRKRHRDPDERHRACARWRLKNPDYHKRRREQDVSFKLAHNLRVRIHHALKNGQKVGSAVRDLGMPVDRFKEYIESKFRDGMTWENWGVVWHLDHINPLSRFDLTNREQFLEACHYSNLQPLLVTENLTKSNKIL